MSRRSDADRLIEDLALSLRATAEDVVPRFLAQMPRAYFEDTDETTAKDVEARTPCDRRLARLTS